DEPASLHFALEPGAHAGATAWVAVCDRAWLRGALQALEAVGLPVARVVPEWAPDPAAPALYAVGTPEDPRIAASAPGQAVVLWPLAAAAQAQADAQIPLYAEPAVAALAEKALGRAAQIQTAATRWLQAAQSPWNLAQFEFASTGGTRVLRRAAGASQQLLRAPQWRAARWGVVALAAAQLGGLNAWAWQEKAALAAKQAGVRGVLTATFPQVKVVVDAPVQMAREVDALRQATGALSPRDLEPLLAALGAALPPGRVPAGVDYAGGEARLRGLALSAEEAQALPARLAAMGYAARMDGDVLTVQAEGTP
ncbi:type II secretion system protein GspL, partial [Ramlibacter sp. H39-3-26]|uniref:type II secretion system protein GspL n=1 Tax=Curvibacter soli TaxID=3031331 RepID=UPI0023DAD593